MDCSSCDDTRARSLAPLAALLYHFWTDDLTANPISYVTNELGETALLL
jgi:hypothetical protein